MGATDLPDDRAWRRVCRRMRAFPAPIVPCASSPSPGRPSPRLPAGRRGQSRRVARPAGGSRALVERPPAAAGRARPAGRRHVDGGDARRALRGGDQFPRSVGSALHGAVPRLAGDASSCSGATSRHASLAGLASRAAQYNGFNLLVGDAARSVYFGSREGEVRAVEPGVHALSNHLLDEPWPKVTKAREAMQASARRRRRAALRDALRCDAPRPTTRCPTRASVSSGSGAFVRPHHRRHYGTRDLHRPARRARASRALRGAHARRLGRRDGDRGPSSSRCLPDARSRAPRASCRQRAGLHRHALPGRMTKSRTRCRMRSSGPRGRGA